MTLIHLLQKVSLLVSVIGLFTVSAEARTHEVSCGICSIEAQEATFPIDWYNNPENYELPQCAFPAGCTGTLLVADTTPDVYLLNADLVSGEKNSCPLSVVINSTLQNKLNASAGSIHYVGHATGGLILTAENGNVTAEGGGDDLLTVDVANGNATLKGMGGVLNITTHNGAITLDKCYGYTLSTHSINNKTVAKALMLYGRHTARMVTENGGIDIRTLRGCIWKKDVLQAVKVIIKAKAVNGAFRDRRPAKQKKLTATERRSAAILKLNTVNGDITVR